MLYPRVPGLVSVVISNFNNENYIQACLDSILRQTYREWELIIVDDASTDDSVSRINAWIAAHSLEEKALLHRMPRNVGFAGALTTGYYLSRGEFIAVQDGDDLSHPERLEKQVQYLQSHPEISVVGSNYTPFRDQIPEQPKGQTWLRYGSDIRRSYGLGKHCVCHGTVMFRGVVFDTVGGPTRKIRGAEDYEFVVKCINAKYEVENLRDILYYYRQHPAQRSLEFFGRGNSRK